MRPSHENVLLKVFRNIFLLLESTPGSPHLKPTDFSLTSHKMLVNIKNIQKFNQLKCQYTFP